MGHAPIPLRLREPPPRLAAENAVQRGGHAFLREYAPGDCWFATKGEGGKWYKYPDAAADPFDALVIAPEHAGARPLIVVFPSRAWPETGNPWCVHSPTCGEKGWGTSGWRVQGEIPGGLVCAPSFDLGGHWHGFIGHNQPGYLENAE